MVKMNSMVIVAITKKEKIKNGRLLGSLRFSEVTA